MGLWAYGPVGLWAYGPTGLRAYGPTGLRAYGPMAHTALQWKGYGSGAGVRLGTEHDKMLE